MTKHRVAVVGLGMAVTPHAKSLLDLRERVEVAYAFSPSPQRRHTFAQHFPFPLADNIDDIFDDPAVEAVLLLTPPNTHLDLVRRCADAGKHVLLEKPLEITLERSEALIETAERAGITLGVVLQHRFRPAGMELKRLIAEGRLGALVGVSAEIGNWRPQSYYDQPGRGTRARDGGGVLLTQAIHTLDLMIALAGLPIEVTGYAATSPVHRMETEDIVAAAMRFANGAMGTIGATTTAYPGFPERIAIIGERGTAVLEGTTLEVRLHDGTTVSSGEDLGAAGAGADPMAFPNDWHRALLADFLDALEQRRPPAISGREALKVHRLIAALLAAAEQGRPVPVGQG